MNCYPSLIESLRVAAHKKWKRCLLKAHEVADRAGISETTFFIVISEKSRRQASVECLLNILKAMETETEIGVTLRRGGNSKSFTVKVGESTNTKEALARFNSQCFDFIRAVMYDENIVDTVRLQALAVKSGLQEDSAIPRRILAGYAGGVRTAAAFMNSLCIEAEISIEVTDIEEELVLEYELP